ncbi:myc box-dependent-interacting protein 1-like isoform X2 [Centruroides vittatus]|uniref:myc box-dependent-interacting protein 1-like isoform X2 n=1 Tax=Centruroides vittatus TaxID=120091 RepID=UPI0035102DA2
MKLQKIMADTKAGNFTRVMQKHAGRAKERLLQNLGKADRTRDEVFEIYLKDFNKQQAAAMKLHKEFKNFVSCARAMQAASKGLIDALSQNYESDWVGYDQIHARSQTLEMLWDDFCHKVNDQVAIPMTAYVNQFNEIRLKIAKRKRKLVDFDGCRHNLQSLQNTRKRDEMKIGRAKEQLDASKRLYEVINNELLDELPALYDSRIPFLVSNLQTLFSAEALFHAEKSNIYTHLTDIMEKLSIESQKGSYTNRQILHQRRGDDARHYEEIEFKRGTLEKAKFNNISIPVPTTDIRRSPTPIKKDYQDGRASPLITRSSSDFRDNRSSPVVTRSTASLKKDPYHDDIPFSRAPLQHKDEKEYEPVDGSQFDDSHIDRPLSTSSKKMDELYDIPVGATTVDLPPGVLYRVRATYKYTAEDVDELGFEGGEIIRVVEFDDPEEQEEGWLIGIKESTGEKGLFPANFTRPI